MMTGNIGYEREADDFYRTPAWCVRALLEHYEPRSTIWEPACGDGAIATVLAEAGYNVVGTDLVNRGYGGGVDFLAQGRVFAWTIITNPPYELAMKFVLQALNLTMAGRGDVAMLMRNEWDCAKSRKHLFTVEPFLGKIVLNKRPVWFPDRKKMASPRHNFAWFIWSWAKPSDQRPWLAWAG